MAFFRQGVHRADGIPPSRLQLPAASHADVDVEGNRLHAHLILRYNIWREGADAQPAGVQADRPLHNP